MDVQSTRSGFGEMGRKGFAGEKAGPGRGPARRRKDDALPGSGKWREEMEFRRYRPSASGGTFTVRMLMPISPPLRVRGKRLPSRTTVI